MVRTQINPTYEELVDHLLQVAAPEKIMAFEASEKANDRARDLVERSSAGELTDEERIELDQMLQADRFISLLKSKAAKALHQQ